ncbi:MAG: DNA translocase FtsK [Desulfitobacteriaceae bacterium]|nr:DNA translocase FtsK [Desulfitobacteriaceae bacterium]MDD4347198.1 DNA translocase FtsK [Desulfitobacteriaceae bacterium]MDD4401707.1 DNA translocase FtsK [Desulfitobacteriaceae bacterium]
MGIYIRKSVSIIFIIIAIFSILGRFGLTGLGRNIFSLFSVIFGNMVWLITFLCLIFSLLLWPRYTIKNSYSRRYKYARESVKANEQASANLIKAESYKPKQTFLLPPTKIVPIRGFDNYFSSMKWTEKADVLESEKMNELGNNFPTYFGEGQRSFKSPVRITTLKGLKRYIEEVDREVLREIVNKESKLSGNCSKENIPERAVKVVEAVETIEPVENAIPEFPEGTETDNENQNIPDEEAFSEQELPTNIQENTGVEQISVSLESKTDEPEINKSKEGIDSVEASEEILTVDKDLTIDEVLALAEDSNVPLRIRKSWRLPGCDLLNNIEKDTSVQETESPGKLEGVLNDFGINTKVIRVTRGPVITRYELVPAPGIKISRIVNLADDIALALAARDVRIEAPIPGKSAVGIEVPNKNPRAVPFREVLETPAYEQNPSKLKVALGKDIADQPVIVDLFRMPHLLIAGATGSGKSVCITTLINSLLFNATPDEVKFLFVDPKMVELNHYNGIPHLLAPVVTDPKKAAVALKWIVKEMETRYELFAAAGVRDIERYNNLKTSKMTEDTAPALPWIIVIIDELADLMLVAAGQVEEAICRIAQMARAAGIHLIIATQRPSVDVITGIIKANIPSRISFAVTSSIDSRTILDATGAEKLLGKGDMLYSPQGINKPQRVQGCLVNDEEVQRIIAYWKSQGGPDYLDPEHLFSENKTEESNGPDDSLFINAGQLFISSGIASVSYLQRKLKLGYARAARLMDMLEEKGVVGGFEGSKPRQILLTLDEFNERFDKG